jgi:hypothetical protein
MAVIGLKCPSCGAPLEMDDDKDFSICQYCGIQVTNEKQYVELSVIKSDCGIADENSLLDRAFLFIEDGNFRDGDKYLERVLDINPENAKAYIGKLLCLKRIKKIDSLSKLNVLLTTFDYYNKAIRFAQMGQLQIFKQLNDEIIERLNKEKASLKQNILCLESNISNNKDYLETHKCEYKTATLRRRKFIILYIALIFLTPIFLVAAYEEHLPVLACFGIAFFILLIIVAFRVSKTIKQTKDYKEEKKELRANEAKLNAAHRSLDNLVKMIG